MLCDRRVEGFVLAWTNQNCCWHFTIHIDVNYFLFSWYYANTRYYNSAAFLNLWVATH